MLSKVMTLKSLETVEDVLLSYIPGKFSSCTLMLKNAMENETVEDFFIGYGKILSLFEVIEEIGLDDNLYVGDLEREIWYDAVQNLEKFRKLLIKGENL